MREIERIGDQLQKAFHGGAWHGPAVEEVLADVDAKMAAADSPRGAHNIWQIVLHITAWQRAVRRWLSGERVQRADIDEWPSITDSSEPAWQAALKTLRHENELLRGEISRADETRLDRPFFREKFTLYTLRHGVIQHDLYHAGQIAILKKMQS